MSVKHIRPEVEKLLPIYRMIRDVLRGPAAVKGGREFYLPIPDPSDTSVAGVYRYNHYVDRAIFFDATARTHEGYIGQIFYREYQVELPPTLEVLKDDIDGEGTTLEQQAKNTAGEVLAFGRAGLLTDYASQVANPTLQDQITGRARPIISLYHPENIINWRWTTVNNRKFLSLVVLKEMAHDDDDGFEGTETDQWRELRMVPRDEGSDQYILVVRIWRNVDGDFRVIDESFPTMGNGNNWDVIPFSFIGSVDNDPSIDKPPMEGMAHVNIGHFRNSADYEESVFMLGQPTPWASGITENWLKDAWNGELRLGSREFIPLPDGGQMGLLQVSPNSLAKDAMDQKERQLVALGAKLAEAKQVQTTATEENRNSVIENSTLSSVAKNTSAAYTKALTFAAMYAGEDTKLVFELNTDFEITRMSPQDRQQLLAEWQGGGITWEEYRWNMKRSGIAYEDDKKAKRTIQAELEESLNLEDEDGRSTGNREPASGVPGTSESGNDE